MKKLYFLLFTITLSFTSFGQVFQESFETGNSGTPSETCNDGTDFFTRTNGTDINNYSVTGGDGSFFFAAQDTDGAPCTSATETLIFDDIDISGFTNLTFAILIAEDDSSDGQEDWDDVSSFTVEVDIDNSGMFTKILQFEAIELRPDGSPSTTNKEPALDTNFDGVGDGTLLTSTFQEFTASMNSGSLADIRLTFTNLKNGDEDIAIDNIRIIENFATTPTISVSGAVSGLDYFENNGPSAEGTFTVSGTNLTADLTVTAPTDFEVSLTSGSGFGSSVVITPSMGTVATTTVYTRLAAGLTANSYMGDATASSTGVTDQTVALSGTVSPDDPQITVSGFVGDFSYFEGTGPSAEDSFNVEGLFLTGDITVTAPMNFEVSLTTGTGFGSSVTITPSMGTVTSTEVFVRMASGLTANSYAGDVTASSTGATDQTIGLTGTVSPAAVCANVGDIIITEVMRNPDAVGDPNGEYFELYNTTTSPIDIQSWVIKDDATVSETHVIASSVIVPAMGYALIANGGTPNGGITPDYTYANDISLGNGADGLIIECSSTTIDEVIWDGTFPNPTGASMELSISTLNSTDNDNGANWLEAVSAFGSGDLGTPGTENDANLLSVDSFDEPSEDFTIFPNPTNTGFINITTKSNTAITVSVFDMLGKQVVSQILNNNILNISNLNAGIYIVKLDQNSASVTKKLVIE
ncbi:T9SS type A sorting domain-containing protein [Aquimarina rubra]|uniref:T9SS type A sorting domain-containing protein n=1 Tax=Aquimarina rubra TaxID=1920033 RepID=A0ABW5LBG2_9FLAO